MFRVKLRPSIITVLQEVRSKEQGQYLITQEKNKLLSLAYFTMIIQVVNKKSYKTK
jgi:hypothetical protein